MTAAKKPESVAEILARRKAAAAGEKTKQKPEPKAPKKAKQIKPQNKKKGKKTDRKPSEKNDDFKTFNSDLTSLVKVPEYMAFIEFMATPKELREIETQGEFSKVFRVDEDTLTNWKKRDGFWLDVREARKQFIREEMLGTALVALKRSVIKDGKAPEVKLLYQLADEFVEKSQVETRKVTMTAEQKNKIADRLKNWQTNDDDDADEYDDAESA